jgi:hypothetical protein
VQVGGSQARPFTTSLPEVSGQVILVAPVRSGPPLEDVRPSWENFQRALHRMFGSWEGFINSLFPPPGVLAGDVTLFGKAAQLAIIWNNRRLFLNWLKGSQSLTRVNNPLSHEEARAIIKNAQRLGLRVDLNPAGLRGLERTGQWGGVPHFKIENIHVPVRSGFVP